MTIKELLTSDSQDKVLEGLAQLKAAGDGQAYDRLMMGMRYQPPTGQDFLLAFAGRLLTNELFTPPDDAPSDLIACRELAIMGLICEAPDSSRLAQAFRTVISSLALAPFGFTGHLPVVDQMVRARNPSGLSDLPAGWLAALPNLSRLDLSGLPITSLDWLEGCEALTWLRVRSAQELTSLSSLPALPITTLDLDGCSVLTDLNGIKQLPQIEHLDLAGCVSLEDLSPLAGVPKISWLNLNRCLSLEDLTGIEALSQLQVLDMGHCSEVRDFSALGQLKVLRELDLTSCRRLFHINELSACSQLTHLVLAGCENLEQVSGLAGLEELSYLDLNECPELRPTPPSPLMLNHSLTSSGVAAYQERLRARS